jgi:hypothetical protein
VWFDQRLKYLHNLQNHPVHLEGKDEYLSRRYPALRSKCIVGCIFTCVRLIIIREPPLIGGPFTEAKLS